MTDFTPKQLEFINLLKTTDQPQGTGTLCSSDGFCCLGLGMAHFSDRLKLSFDYAMAKDAVAYYVNNEREETVASHSFVKLLKLYTKTGSSIGKTYPSLVALNDEGLSFKEIGEHLENYPEAYFTNFTEENNND